MRDKKLIKRYLRIKRQVNVNAGVYVSNYTFTQTCNFNLIVSGLSLATMAKDSVTSQAINCSASVQINNTLRKDNPGMTSTSEEDFFIGGARIQNAGNVLVPAHYEYAAGDTFVMAFFVYLEAVTANIINSLVFASIEYLCPEDYLGVDMFAANPV